MIVGFVIEDNFITTSFIDKDGKPAILKQSVHRDEYELTLILDGNFCYTTKTLENVKLANPKLSVFENILTKPKQKFETSSGVVWNNRQLMAILFKKIIHDLNSTSIHQMTKAHISLPPSHVDCLFEDIEKSIKANGILETKQIGYKQACQRYASEQYKDLSGPVFINLADEVISFVGFDENNLEGFKMIDSILMDELLNQGQKDSPSSDQFDSIESYLIKFELNKIKGNILSKAAREEYHILLKDDYLVFHTPELVIRQYIEKLLTDIQETAIRLDFTSIVFTGRYAKYPLIQDVINNLFTEDVGVNIRIDVNNELKSKGILFN